MAKDDKLGRALQDMGLKNRKRATKKGKEWNDYWFSLISIGKYSNASCFLNW